MANTKSVKKSNKKTVKETKNTREIENGALALLMLFSCIIGILLGYLLATLI